MLYFGFAVIYKSRVAILKVKAKADNWSIDEDGKLLTINDLKTSGHFIDGFMRETGSLYTYHYYRQAALYKTMLEEYCKKNMVIRIIGILNLIFSCTNYR